MPLSLNFKLLPRHPFTTTDSACPPQLSPFGSNHQSWGSLLTVCRQRLFGAGVVLDKCMDEISDLYKGAFGYTVLELYYNRNSMAL